MAATSTWLHQKSNHLLNVLLICDDGDLIRNAFDSKAIQLFLKVWQEFALAKKDEKKQRSIHLIQHNSFLRTFFFHFFSLYIQSAKR